MSAVMQMVNEGKYGFYPCDYETYLKLKKLHKWYYQTLKDYARWYRWNVKEPKNKFYWEPRLNKTDKKVRSNRPIPEPIYCSVFVLRPGRVLHNAVDDLNIIAAYKNARMPKANPDDVNHGIQFNLHRMARKSDGKWIDLNYKELEYSVNAVYEEAKKYFEE